MSDKLVADLREESRLSQRAAWEQADGGQDYCIAAQLADAAADRIEMQAARIAELEAALAPFAALLANHHATMKDDHPVFAIDGNMITAGDLRRAALAADSGAAE